MKKKTLFASLLLILCIDSAQAQSNVKAIGAALDTIMRTYTRDDVIDRIVGQVYSRQPSAQLAARIGKAYFRYFEDTSTGERIAYKTDSARAFRFVREAIRLDPTYAPAYVLAGDICAYYAKKDEALAWLDAGIKANPTDSTLYKASSEVLFKVGMSEALEAQRQGRTKTVDMYQPAIERLEKIREQDPTYPVDLELGRLYYKIYEKGGLTPWVQMAESYGRADRKSMTMGDLQSYALALTQSKQFSTGVELTEYALKQYKDDHSLNDSHFTCAISLANDERKEDNRKNPKDRNPERIIQLYKNAVAAAEQFLAVGIKERFSPLLYLRYGEALVGAKDQEKAIAVYYDLLKKPDLDEKDANAAWSHINSAAIDIANGYVRKSEYDKAFAIFEKYKAELQKAGKLEPYLVQRYAQVYQFLSDEQDGEQKIASLRLANDKWGEVIELFPEEEIVSVYQQFSIQAFLEQLDRNSLGILARPYAERLVALITSKSDASQKEMTFLATAYGYMGFSNLLQSKYRISLDFCEKALAIDPGQQQAILVKEAAMKVVKRR